MEQIKITGLIITCPGDMSVGIPSSQWDIDGEMYFENDQHLNEFKTKLIDAWSLIIDERIYVDTYEQLKNEENMYNEIS